MPNKRSKNQTCIALAMDSELMRGLDQGRKLKEQNRSAFIRSAIRSELQREGISLPPQAMIEPDRATKVRYPEHTPGGPELNEASSGKGVKSTELLKLAAAAEGAPTGEPSGGEPKQRRGAGKRSRKK